MKKNIIVGQSGGPTAVINASLYGVITEGMKHPEEIGCVYGMHNGIEGFLRDDYQDLSHTLSPEELELLKVTPAAYLGSCRYKLPEDLSSPFYLTLFKKLEDLEIGYFFYIGGNDSMDTVSKLSRYAAGIKSDIRFIGIPKTIDNDLIMTDHTPGFASAAKYVATTVREIVLDSSVYHQPAVTIVEIMGRHAGWLTAASVLARKHELDNPMLIYLPEADFDFKEFSTDLQAAFKRSPSVVVCVSEGISDAGGRFICEYDTEAKLDNFGHKMLTGSGKYLENLVKEKLGVKVRSVELNVCQRCSSSCLSATDLDEAISSGKFAVQAALSGETGKMISFIRKSNSPYELEFATADVNNICNMEKAVPRKWITQNGSDISNEFLAYAKPLIQGSVEIPMKDGLPHFAFRK